MINLKHPFRYQAPTPKNIKDISFFRDLCHDLYEEIQGLPASRERSIACTKLEEVSMWLNKAIVFDSNVPAPPAHEVNLFAGIKLDASMNNSDPLLS